MKQYILGIDEGTTSARAVVYDVQKGKIISVSGSPIKQIYPQNGWVEQDANQIVNAQFAAIEEAIRSAKIKPTSISAVAITNQRESIVAWDSNTGKPIYNSICWQCRRTAKQIEKLSPELVNKIKNKTGLIADAYFSASKMAWILKNVPTAKDLAKKGRLKMGTIDSYLAYILTGKFVTDTTNASRTMLFNIKTLEWDKEMLELWNIPLECLPTVVSSDQVVGNCSMFGDAPLCSIIGDQQSSLFGQNCLNVGDTKVTYGTGGFILLNTGNKVVNNKKLLATVAYTIKGKTTYALEGSIYSACSGINWLKDGMSLYKDVAQTTRMAESVADNGGVYFVPAFTGLGAPYWNSNARATLTGLTFASRPEHIVRAMLESMAYNTFDIVNQVNTPINRISVDGGGSKNKFLLQFLADITGVKVCKALNSESTVLGAIKIAEMYLNIPREDDYSTQEIYLPTMDTDTRKKHYAGWKKAVEKTCL